MGGKWLPGHLYFSRKMSLMGCFDKHATVSFQTTALSPLSCTNKPPPHHTQTHTYPSIHTSNTHHLPQRLYEQQESKGIVGTVIPVIVSNRKYHINHSRAARSCVQLCFTGKLRDSKYKTSLINHFCIFYSGQYFRYPHLSSQNEWATNYSQ